ncbi:hypothetical protein HG531_002727 [Fusarium graminearum]|nr:hypothetical protein HG531_002727 [Fusarium graminearum]
MGTGILLAAFSINSGDFHRHSIFVLDLVLATLIMEVERDTGSTDSNGLGWCYPNGSHNVVVVKVEDVVLEFEREIARLDVSPLGGGDNSLEVDCLRLFFVNRLADSLQVFLGQVITVAFGDDSARVDLESKKRRRLCCFGRGERFAIDVPKEFKQQSLGAFLNIVLPQSFQVNDCFG